MSRVESSQGKPIYGVSTAAPQNRKQQEAELQENFMSDNINMLTRRPSSIIKVRDADLVSEYAIPYKQVHYYDGAKKVTVRLYERNNNNEVKVKVYEDLVYLKQFILPAEYTTNSLEDYELRVINQTVFILNKIINVTLSSDTDFNTNSAQPVTYISILEAFDYEETINLKIKANGVTITGTYTTDKANDNDPDKSRAVNEIALGLYSNIISYDPELGRENICIRVLGNTIAVYNRLDNKAGVEIIISGVNNKEAVAVLNKEIDSDVEVPKYAIHNTIIKVNPIGDTRYNTSYYLRAVSINNPDKESIELPDALNKNENVGAFGNILEEVVWKEHRDPNIQYKLNANTLPHILYYNNDSTDYVLEEAPWEDRRVGDEESVPNPDFIGFPITDISIFQNRLAVLTGSYLNLSTTDNIYNFFGASAKNPLVTDPILITSSAIGTSKLTHLVNHNRDLLVFTRDKQFKLSGSEAATPNTTGIVQTTSYSYNQELQPKTMGNSVYFITDYGNSLGVFEYQQKENTNEDKSIDITDHIRGYIEGDPELFIVNSNLNMIILKTTNSDNEVYVYKELQDGDKRVNSWSKWVFPSEWIIKDIEFEDEEVLIYTEEYILSINIYNRDNDTDNKVYLDELEKVSISNTRTIYKELTLSDLGLIGSHLDEDSIIILGNTTDSPYTEMKFTIDENNDKLIFNEDVYNGESKLEFYIGKKYESKYTLTRPYMMDEKGNYITSDNIRILKYIFTVNDTPDIKFRIDSDYYDTVEQEWNSYVLNGNDENLFDNVPKETTADVEFYYMMNANLGTATLIADTAGALNLSTITWQGQLVRRNQRI